ncbi:MAG TPA: TRIC cation channel family protein, partial [Clostridia bacterium]|nr:TRIC cation channel family protein [Clostridia bacterium]
VFWVNDSAFVINAFLTAVFTFYLVRWHELPGLVLLVADGLVLAFFTMLGTRKGLALTDSLAVAVMMGVITGVAGGVLRDALIGELPIVFRSETYLYATAAFFGAIVFVGLTRIPEYARADMIVGVAMTFLLRLVGIRWRIGLPLFRPKNGLSGPDSGPN